MRSSILRHAVTIFCKPLLFIILSGILWACAHNTPAPDRAYAQQALHQLLADTTVFASHPEIAKVQPPDEVMKLTPVMQHILDTEIRSIRDPLERAQALKQLLLSPHKLAVHYTALQTQNAANTFFSRQANCMSFSVLYISMARYVDLPVNFQLVSIPPMWDMQNNTWIRNRHINVAADIKLPSGSVPIYVYTKDRTYYNAGNQYYRYVIDIDPTIITWKSKRQLLSDEQALGSYYANIAAEKLLNESDIGTAYAHIKQALYLDPLAGEAWNTLGILYTRLQRTDLAEAVYWHAIQIDPKAYSAMSNLLRLAQQQNATATVSALQKKVESFQQKNPYYHHLLAQYALHDGMTDQAISHLRKALSLKSDEADFYYALASIYAKLNDIEKTKHYLIQAHNHSNAQDQKRYRAKLARLQDHSDA